MNNPCEKIREQIATHVLGLLGEDETQTLQNHLDKCPACKEYADALFDERQMLEGFGRTLDADMNAREMKVIETLNTASTKTIRSISIWRNIMNSKLTKIAVAAVIIIGVLVGVYTLTGSFDGSSIAFAQVLEKIQASSYTFDLSITMGNDKSPDQSVMVCEPGQMRIDSAIGLGGATAIIDVTRDKTLILFHQFKTAQYLDVIANDKEKYDLGAKGFLMLSAGPIKNLWNLLDGTEKKLGEQDIKGRLAQGFAITYEGDLATSRITIWADVETCDPILVEIRLKGKNAKTDAAIWTMDNFAYDTELEPSLFNMNPPAGYTLAYQKTMDELEASKPKESDQAKDIESMLSLWKQGDKTQAIEMLLGIDWSKPISFSKRPYIFSLTEKEYVSLVVSDQQNVMSEVIQTSGTLKKVAIHMVGIGKTAVEKKDYEKAEQYLTAGSELGKLLTQNQEGILIGRLVGIAVEKFTLKELVNLYKATNDDQKLNAAEERIGQVEQEQQGIKDMAAGIR